MVNLQFFYQTVIKLLFIRSIQGKKVKIVKTSTLKCFSFEVSLMQLPIYLVQLLLFLEVALRFRIQTKFFYLFPQI